MYLGFNISIYSYIILQGNITDSVERVLKRASYRGDCHSPHSAFERSVAFQGAQDYRFFTNYARAFPRWCITGYGGPRYSKNNS